MTKEEILDYIDDFKPEGTWKGPVPNYGSGFNCAKREISDWFSENYDEIVGDKSSETENPSSVLFQITDDKSIVLEPNTVGAIEIVYSDGYANVKIYTNTTPRSATYNIECGLRTRENGEEKARVLKAKLEKELAKRGIEIVDLRSITNE